MRFHFGNLSAAEGFQPESAGWRRIRGPNLRFGYLLAGLVGLTLVCGLLAGITGMAMLSISAARSEEIVLLSTPAARSEEIGANQETDVSPGALTPWVTVILTLILSIPAHELLHLVWLPHFGLSPQTVVVLWPTRLRFGVYYEGTMSRTRWLLMRAAPFAVLSLIPAGLLVLFGTETLNFVLETSLVILLLVNGIGSGGDVLAMLVVLFQIPPAARLCFRGGRAYWKPAAPVDRATSSLV